MNASFNGVIQRKLALMETHISKLEQALRGISRERFAADWGLRMTTERALQVAAEIIIDVAERVIALKGGGPVATASEAIERLAQLGVIRSSEIYVGIVRFRNLIVHHYEEINPDVLFDLVTNRLNDFRRFRQEIDKAAVS